MINVNYTPIKTHIEGQEVSPELAQSLYDLLSFQNTGYLFSTKFLANQWDGTTRYFTKTNTFKSGLLGKVLHYFDDQLLPYRLIGFPVIPRLPQRGTYNLRPHQVQGVAAMFNTVRGILQSPPRSGKTLMAGAFLDQSRRWPAIFMCNSIDIASQTLEKFRTYIPDVKFGFVGDGQFELGDITIMTVQSAVAAYEIEYKMRRAAGRKKKGKEYKRIGSDNDLTNEQRLSLREYIERAKTIIYDECHHSQSSIAVHIFGKLKSAEAIFGLSATPNYGRPEDMIIESVIGQVFFQVSYSELIKAGWLLKPAIFMYKLPKTHDMTGLSYPTIYKAAVTDNEFRNVVIARMSAKLNRQGKTVLIIVDTIKHGNMLHAMYPAAVTVYGSADLETRNRVKNELSTGVCPCVISTLWDEGADIPGLHYVINAAGGASPVDTLQRLRSITPNPDDVNKTYGGVIDFLHREKYLQSHSKFRRMMYEQESDFHIEVRDISKWTLDKARSSFN